VARLRLLDELDGQRLVGQQVQDGPDHGRDDSSRDAAENPGEGPGSPGSGSSRIRGGERSDRLVTTVDRACQPARLEAGQSAEDGADAETRDRVKLIDGHRVVYERLSHGQLGWVSTGQDRL